MWTGLCVLALAGACCAQLNQEHTAKIVLEDGTPFTTTPEIIPAINRQGLTACVLDAFGGGTVQYIVSGMIDL